MSKSVYGKVLEVELDTTIKKQSGGTYKGYRLTYKMDDGKVQTLEKANASLTFGAGPAVKETLQALEPGDDFSLYLEKNEKGFNDVVGLVKGRDENASFSAAQQGNTAVASGNKPSFSGGKTVSTYETPEERKLKQRLIVRQAALNQALEFVPVTKEGRPIDDVLERAEQFENWVYRGL